MTNWGWVAIVVGLCLFVAVLGIAACMAAGRADEELGYKAKRNRR
jgi:hypothetical protein